jgi:anti-anti-sigma factor
MQLTLLISDDNLVRLQCVGDITQYDVQARTNPLEAVMGRGGYSRTVLLSLEKTGYIDSSGISWLISCHKHFVEAGGKLIIHSVPPTVFQVLQLLRMHLLLNIAANDSAARDMAQGVKK